MLDVQLPGLSGLELQQELAKGQASLPIIFITGHGDIPMTVRAMKAGAIDFLTKPFRDEDLLNAVAQALHHGPPDGGKHAPRRPKRHRTRKTTAAATAMLLGDRGAQCGAAPRLHRRWRLVAPTEATVLLCGETGTGKELLARAIHHRSARRPHAFVTLNCAAIPTGLLESELFGHEKGAFTGAVAQRLGRFELAHRGHAVSR